MSRHHRTYWMICAVLGVVAVLWSVPTIWMTSLSMQPNELLARTTTNTFLGLIPVPFTWENFVRLFSFGLTPRWFLNSAIVAVGMTALVLVLSTTAGYAFARIPFKGRGVMLALVLAGLTVPEQVIFIPLYTMFADWGLHNTHIALIIPRLAVPLGVFLMMQFYKGIPKELEEAAALDGANRFVIFTRVVLPLSIPATTTLAILTFLYAWNDYLWPLVSSPAPGNVHHHCRSRLDPGELRAKRRPRQVDGLRRHRQPASDHSVRHLPALCRPRHRPRVIAMRCGWKRSHLSAKGRNP